MTEPLTSTEYAELRRTIAARGTARMVLVPLICLGWAALTLPLLLLGGPPAATLLPLTVLVGGSRQCTRCTSEPNGSGATSRSTMRPIQTGHDGKRPLWPWGPHCPGAELIPCFRWFLPARRSSASFPRSLPGQPRWNLPSLEPSTRRSSCASFGRARPPRGNERRNWRASEGCNRGSAAAPTASGERRAACGRRLQSLEADPQGVGVAPRRRGAAATAAGAPRDGPPCFWVESVGISEQGLSAEGASA